MIVNGFEIRELPDGYVDCVSWCGTVLNTLNSVNAAIAWANTEDPPRLSPDAKAALAQVMSSRPAAQRTRTGFDARPGEHRATDPLARPSDAAAGLRT